MKKLMLTVVLIAAALCGSAQSKIKIDANGNYIAVKASRDSVPPKPTGKTFTDTKGKVYPVHVTAKGKLYVIRTSKNTGKQYKQYLKL